MNQPSTGASPLSLISKHTHWHMDTHRYTREQTHIHRNMRKHTYTQTQKHTHAHMHTQTHRYTREHTHIHRHTRNHTYIQTQKHMHAHTHAHRHYPPFRTNRVCISFLCGGLRLDTQPNNPHLTQPFKDLVTPPPQGSWW